MMGGYLNNPATTGECEYCQYSTGDQYTATLNVYWGHRWRNYGIFWAYVLFNIMIIFVFTGIYCGGLKNIAGVFKSNPSGAPGDQRKDQLSEKGTKPVSGP